jgi:hypothetical protein
LEVDFEYAIPIRYGKRGGIIVEKTACARQWEEVLRSSIKGNDSERKQKLSRLSNEVDSRRCRLVISRWTLVTLNLAFIIVYLSHLLLGIEFPYFGNFLEPKFVNGMYAVQLAVMILLSPIDARFLFSNKQAENILGKSVQDSDLEVINNYIGHNISTEKAIALMSALVIYLGQLG